MASEPHVRDHRAEPKLPARLLLRESYREGGKVKNRTLANISHWPPAKIEALRAVLRDEGCGGRGGFRDRCAACRTGMWLQRLAWPRVGLDRASTSWAAGQARTRALALAMIVARLIDPAAKLATARGAR